MSNLSLPIIGSIVSLLVLAGPSFARSCKSGDTAVVTGQVTKVVHNDDGYSLAVQASETKLSDEAVSTCTVLAVDSDKAPPASCSVGSKLTARGVIFFAAGPVALAADRILCEGQTASGDPPREQVEGSIGPPPAPLRASDKDKKWIRAGAKLFKEVAGDERRRGQVCVLLAAKTKSNAIPNQADKEAIRNAYIKVGDEFTLLWDRENAAEDKVKATTDFAEYRDAYNALARACPGQSHHQITARYWGYFRTKSGLIDITYDPDVWSEFDDKSGDRSYEAPIYGKEIATELALGFRHEVKAGAYEFAEVDVDGIHSNLTLDEVQKIWVERDNVTSPQVVELAGRRVLVGEAKGLFSGTKMLVFYFPTKSIGIMVEATIPSPYYEKVKPHVERLVTSIRAN